MFRSFWPADSIGVDGFVRQSHSPKSCLCGWNAVCVKLTNTRQSSSSSVFANNVGFSSFSIIFERGSWLPRRKTSTRQRRPTLDDRRTVTQSADVGGRYCRRWHKWSIRRDDGWGAFGNLTAGHHAGSVLSVNSVRVGIGTVRSRNKKNARR